MKKTFIMIALFLLTLGFVSCDFFTTKTTTKEPTTQFSTEQPTTQITTHTETTTLIQTETTTEITTQEIFRPTGYSLLQDEL